jgi:hypothetical protein
MRHIARLICVRVGTKRKSKIKSPKYPQGSASRVPRFFHAPRGPEARLRRVAVRLAHHRNLDATCASIERTPSPSLQAHVCLAPQQQRESRPSWTAALGQWPSIDPFVAVGELLGQPRFPKALNQQLRVCLSAPTHPRGYCEGGIDLEQTRRRLASLGIPSEMSESGRETRVSSPKGGGLTKGFLPGDEGLVKSAELNKGIPYPDERMH